MFRRHKKYERRHSFIPFIIFRSLLSLIIFAVLLAGIYSAFRQFSGFDIVKVNVLQRDILGLLASFIPSGITLPPQLEKLKENEISGGETNTEDNLPNKSKLSFKFILVADSHNDNENLGKALRQAESHDPSDFVVGLGDYTDIGTIDELRAAKKVFDNTGIRYFVTSGDHDLWDSRNKEKDPTTNFNQVFGRTYQSFSYKNARFLIIDNSDNYLGLGEAQSNWLKEEIERINTEGPGVVLAFVHEPLYHPSSTRVMGKVTNSLMDEAKEITKMLKDAGVREVFAGDIHYFTEYSEPETGLSMTTVGALTAERNAQTPRYVVVSVFDDGSIEVEDVEVR